MDNSTIFERKTLKAAPKFFKENRPELKKERKIRSDKKHDIKFKLSVEDKKLLKLKAIDHRMSLTTYCSHIVKMDLILEKEYGDYDYDNDGVFVHAALEHDYYEMLKTLATEWDLPFRKAVHRIIKAHIEREYGGVAVWHYGDANEV